jgi:hypothetical protein
VSLLTGLPEGNYNARLLKNGQQVDSKLIANNTVNFGGLSGGTYEICFTADTLSGFERCSTIVLFEPVPLSVQSVVNPAQNEITLELDGTVGEQFEIILNGDKITTSNTSISLPLSRIENRIEVRAGTACQGVYRETIILSNEVFIYPNPVLSGEVSIYLGESTASSATVSLYDFSGSLVYQKDQSIDHSLVKLNVNGLKSGIYMVQVRAEGKLITHKLVIR